MTERDSNGRFSHWTAPLLKEHYDAVLKARAEEVERTRQQMEKRLDGMNEFREALNDVTNNFVTRTELRATVVTIAAVVGGIAALLAAILH
jgi:ElaB/YqjD/DUF883 family membrane-anchored ribosome-binding protein